MKDIRIINYCVKGIKTLDEWACLSFYKKSFTRNFSIQNYNLKGIYGANGAGKSAIIHSVKIFRSLLCDSSYLSNSIAQQELRSLINKHLGYAEFKADYLVRYGSELRLYRYQIRLSKYSDDKFEIEAESLAVQNALSHNDVFTEIYSACRGEAEIKGRQDAFTARLIDSTKNLLTFTSMPAAFMRGFKNADGLLISESVLFEHLLYAVYFGYSLHVYLESGDDHADYYLDSILCNLALQDGDETRTALIGQRIKWDGIRPYEITDRPTSVIKPLFGAYEEQVGQLYEFLRIFKTDLQGISIDKRENKDLYYCTLIMDYREYSIDAEFESTGIKKLIRLYSLFKNMVNGEIVFIDELDSNLHDVYLCALLEYLKEYAKGQLCFTTHNIGPMDVLKKNKMSIDFLSVDHKVYSWKKNGNYSPSSLYKNGMIEGSPFNVDSMNFIRAFGAGGQ